MLFDDMVFFFASGVGASDGNVFLQIGKYERSLFWSVSAAWCLSATNNFRINLTLIYLYCRLVTWFSYHLSNFKFTFAWDDWEASVKFNPEHPQPKFIREVMLKTMRYTTFFWDAILRQELLHIINVSPFSNSADYPITNVFVIWYRRATRPFCLRNPKPSSNMVPNMRVKFPNCNHSFDKFV